MTRKYGWIVVLGGVLVLIGSSCSVQQQQEVLGTIGQVIPGSRNSLFNSLSSSTPSPPETPPPSTQTLAVAPSTPPVPAPRNDLGQVDAQLVLQTLQRAMKDDPTPFLECLDTTQCRSALTTHLIRLQGQAQGTLELPPVYDRYDLKRGKE